MESNCYGPFVMRNVITTNTKISRIPPDHSEEVTVLPCPTFTFSVKLLGVSNAQGLQLQAFN